MNRSSTLSILALAFGMMVAASPASARQDECSVERLQVASEGVVLTYDPFDRDGNFKTIPLRLTTTGCDNARVELVVVPDLISLSPSGQLQATNGRQSLPVGLTVDGAPARVVSNAVNAFDGASRTGRVAGNSGQLSGEGLRLSLAEGAEVAPGRYSARATVLARVSGQADTIPVASTSFFIEIDVQPSFRLAAGVERARLWLGELTEGKRSQPVTFLAFSNTGYALKIRSEHAGRMTLAGSSRADAPGVPYDLTVSDDEVDWLDGRGELRYHRPRSLLRTHEVVATAGVVDGRRPAGDYKDWVTIEISPLIS